jgi:hypothetical protein
MPTPLYGPQESRGRDTRSKCKEHKDHRESKPTLFWDSSKRGTYVCPPDAAWIKKAKQVKITE